MDTGYNRCYKGVEKINKDLVPALNDAYKYYQNSSKNVIENSQCLNSSRAITKEAKKVLSDGYRYDKGANKKVLEYLDRLESEERSLIKHSKDLNELLKDHRAQFIKDSKDLIRNNSELMNELSNGTTPATDLEQKVQKLGKSFVDIINNILPNMTKDIKNFIKKLEDRNCNDIQNYKYQIDKLDFMVLKSIRAVDWYEYRSGFFERAAAFEYSNYEASV